MSRALKVFVGAAIAVMIVVLATCCRVHWDAIAGFSALDAQKKRLLVSVLVTAAFLPAWVGFCAWGLNRQMTQRHLHLSREHLRFYEVSMVILVMFTVAGQYWMTFGYAYTPGWARNGVFARAMLVFIGAFVVVYGNFHAKVPPATGALAPAPAVWIRGMLRNGWAMVLLGLAIVAMAICLPLKLLRVFDLAILIPALLIIRSQARLMWPRKPQPTA